MSRRRATTGSLDGDRGSLDSAQSSIVREELRNRVPASAKKPYRLLRRWLRRAVGLVAYEWRLRVDTARAVSLDELEHGGEGGFFDYAATDWLTLWRGLSYLDAGPDDVFVDIGSGKGRAVLVAAMYPFRRVIGLELSPSLNAIARANVERSLHRLRCKDVELVTADATQWELPDDVTVVFLANPYISEPFRQTIAVFERSQAQSANATDPVLLPARGGRVAGDGPSAENQTLAVAFDGSLRDVVLVLSE